VVPVLLRVAFSVAVLYCPGSHVHPVVRFWFAFRSIGSAGESASPGLNCL